jgi:hypothetical protein
MLMSSYSKDTFKNRKSNDQLAMDYETIPNLIKAHISKNV